MLERDASRLPAALPTLERETGIEPATNSLEGCDSTTELLPPSRRAHPPSPLRRGEPAHRNPATTVTRHTGRAAAPYPISPAIALVRRLPAGLHRRRPRVTRFGGTAFAPGLPSRSARARARARAKAGGEGRIRTSEAAGAADLQSAAFDRSATSPASVTRCCPAPSASPPPKGRPPPAPPESRLPHSPCHASLVLCCPLRPSVMSAGVRVPGGNPAARHPAGGAGGGI
jgi:hypothetical protein